jgi:hypothetical protein
MCILFLFFLQLQIKISESQLKVRIPAKNVEEEYRYLKGIMHMDPVLLKY